MNERIACGELALVSGSVFETMFRFLPGPVAEWALSSEALFRVIAGIPDSTQDPGVAMAQLGWWQSELSRADHQASQHPVLRAAYRTGVLNDANAPGWSQWVMAVAGRVEADTPESVEAWLSDMLSVEGRRALLEAGLAPMDPQADVVQRRGLAAGTLDYLGRLCHAGDQALSLPLSVSARFRLDPARVDHAAFSRALAYLAQRSLEALYINSEEGAAGTPGESIAAAVGSIRHAVVVRRLSRFSKLRHRVGAVQPPRGNVGDVWCAWRSARRALQHLDTG